MTLFKKKIKFKIKDATIGRIVIFRNYKHKKHKMCGLYFICNILDIPVKMLGKLVLWTHCQKQIIRSIT